jgi:hypothetical protein
MRNFGFCPKGRKFTGFEKKVLKKIFEPKKDDVTGECSKI